MPIVNIYFANSPESNDWHDNMTSLFPKEGGDMCSGTNLTNYISYRIVNNTIKLSYPHRTNRDFADSNPIISYISGSPSYNVFYKIVIVK